MKLNGPKLRRKREDGGLTIEGVVAIVRKQKQRITIGTVSNAENSKSITPGNAKKICDALDVEIADYRMPLEAEDAPGKGGRRSRATKKTLSNPTRVA